MQRRDGTRGHVHGQRFRQLGHRVTIGIERDESARDEQRRRDFHREREPRAELWGADGGQSGSADRPAAGSGWERRHDGDGRRVRVLGLPWWNVQYELSGRGAERRHRRRQLHLKCEW